MNFSSPNREDLDGTKLPDSIYASVVSSLYHDPKSLIIGMGCAVAASLVLFIKTQDPIQLVFGILFFAFGITRVLGCRAYYAAAKKPLTRGENEYWERIYAILGASFILILGLWYATAVYRFDDPYVKLLSLLICVGHLTGLIGRNFSSAKVINLQSSIFGVLLLGGTLISGDGYHIVLAAFVLPLLIAVRVMCERLRHMLFEAELTAYDNKVIAQRFDVALDNIGHGIAMFNPSGTIVVSNERFTQLVGLGDWNIVNGDISLLTVARLDGQENRTLFEEIKDCLASGEARRFVFNLASGQIIEAHYNSMPKGGALLLSDITERVASENSIRDLANFDPLTSLPNRRFFVEEVHRNLQDENGKLKDCAMFFIDLDKFKEVNDTLGHGIGDDLLVTIAERLNQLLPEGGIACRFGGDEFVVVVPSMIDPGACGKIATMLIQNLSRPMIIDDNKLSVGASVGISISPTDAEDAELLLQYADAALYEAKGDGRGTHVFYNETIGETIRLRRELETDLRRAIDNNELTVFFQPLISLKNGGIACCEALVRWTHPTRGAISPAEMIPIAEESGMIVDLGKHVLKTAMLECLSWNSNTAVAVNVSTIQFLRSDIIKTVTGLLQETGLPPHKLEIEITESVMMDNLQDVSQTLNALSELGVRISLDDFGTGFSNLNYLHALPFDKVKIDRSFIENAIADERSLVLLKGVVDLIRRLKLSIVLEGIENEQQVDIITHQIDVDEVQGYLFGRPMPANDIYKFIKALNREPATQRGDASLQLAG